MSAAAVTSAHGPTANVDVGLLMGTIDGANRRVTAALAEAKRRCHGELVASQRVTMEYAAALHESALAVGDEATSAAEKSNALLAKVRELDATLGGMDRVAQSVAGATAAVDELEDLLTELEAAFDEDEAASASHPNAEEETALSTAAEADAASARGALDDAASDTGSGDAAAAEGTGDGDETPAPET